MQTVRLDPEFDDPSKPGPYPQELKPVEGRKPPTKAQYALFEKAIEEVNAEVRQIPTPVLDALGRIDPSKPPSQVVMGETIRRLEDTYNFKSRTNGFINKTTALPAGANWDGGYGSNVFHALKALEQQLNFFHLRGMTPREAAVQLYKTKTGMANREEEVASALGMPSPRMRQVRYDYISGLEENYRTMLKQIVSEPARMNAISNFIKGLDRTREGYELIADPTERRDTLARFDAVAQRIRAMRGGRKSRNVRRSKTGRKRKVSRGTRRVSK
jgi:hypothetical protein